ncbi:hypothetical protein KGY79_12430 [Candidatus Bipolaricaulota bacterium]|nr:hypothetical protein [Candidatus Bipolaricaulota bacterium]
MKKLSLLLLVGLILTFSLSAVAGNWSTYITYEGGDEENILYAGQYEPVGTVTINGSGVTFEADGGYLFSELHLDVEDDYKDIPRAPGQFDYGEEFSVPVDEYTFSANVSRGDAVAAHAVVVKDDGSGWEETAWAEDDNQVGNYFDEDNKGKFRKSPIVLDVRGKQGLFPVLDRAELPDRVQVKVQYPGNASQPYFLLTIEDLSGNVLYEDVATWCIDLDTTIGFGTYEADVYGNRQSHRYVEKIAELFGYSNYDMSDIQVAIWVVKEGVSTSYSDFSTPNADQQTVEEILDEVGYTNYS